MPKSDILQSPFLFIKTLAGLISLQENREKNKQLFPTCDNIGTVDTKPAKQLYSTVVVYESVN